MGHLSYDRLKVMQQHYLCISSDRHLHVIPVIMLNKRNFHSV